MRQFKGEIAQWKQEKKDVPKGVCSLCGGIGRFCTTYKHKSPVISVCWQCAGTGNIQIEVTYKGEMQAALWTESNYKVISETDTHYVIINRDKQLVQVEKDNFELVTY